MSAFTDSGHSTLLKQRDFKGSFRPEADTQALKLNVGFVA